VPNAQTTGTQVIAATDSFIERDIRSCQALRTFSHSPLAVVGYAPALVVGGNVGQVAHRFVEAGRRSDLAQCSSASLATEPRLGAVFESPRVR
jgi:hypothetical protein